MTRNVIALFAILTLLPHFLFSQKQGFEITGHLEGLQDGELVVLGNRFADFHYLTVMDSCRVVNGNFHLQGAAVQEGPRLYEILFNYDSHRRTDPNNPNRNIGGVSCELFVDNGDKITMRGGDINKMPDADIAGELTIEGSPTTTAKISLSPLFFNFSQIHHRINRRMAEIQDSIGFDRGLMQSLVEVKDMINKTLGFYMVNVAASWYKPAIPLLFSHYYLDNYHWSFLPAVYDCLDERTRNSYYGKILKEKAAIAIGQPLPGFTLPTLNGKMISLKDEVVKGKITLVHLWGSNSFQRENYQKELLTLYKKYHEKGLNVIAVSADSAKSDWAKRVQFEQYPWVNVSDLKGNLKGGIVNDVYHEGGHSMPNTTNILLNAEGKIIAWDVSGVELQYYLWKYLGD